MPPSRTSSAIPPKRIGAEPGPSGTITVMCRNIDPYPTSWVCVPCRLAFSDTRTCPQCRTPMVDAGRDFAAPKRTNTNAWKAVELVLAAGLNYDSCGCTGPGPRPHTKAEMRRWTNEAHQQTQLYAQAKGRRVPPQGTRQQQALLEQLAHADTSGQ